VKSKISDLFNQNSTFGPNSGRTIKIKDEKLKWEAKPKVNTLEKINYKPKGGNVQIVQHKIEFGRNARTKLDTGMDVVIVKKPKNTTRYSHDISLETSMNETNVLNENENFGDWSSSQEKKLTNMAFKDIHEYNESILSNHNDHENSNLSNKNNDNIMPNNENNISLIHNNNEFKDIKNI
jgi:hypothetical protein